MKKENKKALKYLEALSELYNILSYTDKVSMAKFMSDHGLDNNWSGVAQDGKLFENYGTKGKGAKYRWTTIKPNLSMATELDRRMKAKQKAYNSGYQKKIKKSNLKKPVAVNHNREKFIIKEQTSKKVSILWGMFKYEKK
jgi:hypothetical protein